VGTTTTAARGLKSITVPFVGRYSEGVASVGDGLPSWLFERGGEHEPEAQSREVDDTAAPSVELRLTRSELRVVRAAARRRERLRRSPLGLVLVWWFYPLVALIGVCVWLAVQQSATVTRPGATNIVVQSPDGQS